MFDLYDSITAGFAGGVLAAASIVFVLVSIASYVLIVIGWWKIFTKAGEAGWKSLIPFYNGYTISKICWETKYFWFTLLAAVAGASSPASAVLSAGCFPASARLRRSCSMS